MGKTKCSKKKASCINYDDSSSSSTSYSSSSNSCSSSLSSKYCCPKYPKCYCVVNKCAPIYYPNNCVGQYPCNPCNPCNPYRPPCPPSQSSLKYTSSNTIITTDSALTINSPNVFVCNPSSANITLTLPLISSLASCGYIKMFVISNISSTYSVDIIVSAGDNLTTSSVTLTQGQCVTLYADYISSGSYWVVI
jgi:hypothetical protein